MFTGVCRGPETEWKLATGKTVKKAHHFYLSGTPNRTSQVMVRHLSGYRVNRDLRTADWKYDRIRKAGLACPATGSLPIITLLSFNYSVWSFCKLAERLGTALLVFLPGAFFRSDNALLHFALAVPSPIALGEERSP